MLIQHYIVVMELCKSLQLIALQVLGQPQSRPEGQRPRTVGQAVNDVNVNVDVNVDETNDVESRQQFLQVTV